MRRRGRRHTRALIIAVTVATTLSTFAVAYWSGNGTGSATTVLTEVQTLSLAPGTPTAQLYPGDDASVAIVATNPNPFFVRIASLVLDTDEGAPFVVDAGHSGCDVAALSFVTQDNGGAGWEVPPRTGSTDGTLTIDLASALQMSAAASNACQGATFTVHLEARS